MDAEIISLLDACDYFKGLSGQNRKSLAAVCISRTFNKRDYLFLEGEKGHSIFLLVSGGVQLVKTSAEGREVVIKTVEPGEVFAEVILFEEDSYPVTAIAIKKSTAYKLPKRGFLRLLETESFRNDFVAGLMHRLRYLTNRILYLTACDVEERFFRFLADQYGRKEEYDLSLSKKHIAAAIGTTPETFSRLMLGLRNQGKVTQAGRILRLKPGFWNEWG